MEDKNMTALFSLFIRAYHYKNNKYRVLNDKGSTKLIKEEEYNSISSNLINGISFFDPNYKGNDHLKHIMSIISPSVLGRSIYTSKILDNDIKLGCKQYIMLGSGYDVCNNKNIKVFEVDRDNIIEDKLKRVKKKEENVTYIKCDFSDNNWINNIKNNKNYKNEKTFCSMLGLTYYLTKDEFENTIKSISSIMSEGDTIIFDYPLIDNLNIIEELANASQNTMKSKYTCDEIINILDKYNFLVYENLTGDDMTNTYFYNYNTLNPNNKMIAPTNVNYCLAVKKSML